MTNLQTVSQPFISIVWNVKYLRRVVGLIVCLNYSYIQWQTS